MPPAFFNRLSDIFSYTIPFALALTTFFGYSKVSNVETKHNFIFQEKRYYPEYDAIAYLYVHKKHGSPFLHIETNDTHNFFATTYRTTCIDDTGRTHVLEHMSLQGSESFPINSVFSELLKRSLATLLNAFTSIEWTAYPFSTTNYKDFHNILDVYLDSSFHPQLQNIAFESECHHLEFITPNDTSSPLRHSGVVYNEMVGSLSEPSNYFESLIRRNLYPDSVFGLEYGGYPPAITTLTLENLKETHKRYYHPSNALFFHYGSFDIDEILEKVDKVISNSQFDQERPVIKNIQNPQIQEEEITQKSRKSVKVNRQVTKNSPRDKGQVKEKIVYKENEIFHMKTAPNSSSDLNIENLIKQPRWKQPHNVIADGPLKNPDDADKVTVSISWMASDLRNITDIVDLQFLSLLLTETQLSPLYKALIETRIGTNFINTGFSNYVRSPYFSIGLEGVKMEDAVKFNETVIETLNDIYNNGFDKNRIQSTLHAFELSQKTVSADRGLQFWESIISMWIHDVDPFELLDDNWQIERIKRVLEINPKYFELVLKNHLIDNSHRLDLIMKGVPNFQRKQAEKVSKELEEKKKEMSQEELDQIVKETEKILQFVDAKKPIELLPSVTSKDINRTQPKTLNYESNDNIVTFIESLNDMVFVNIKCEIPLDSDDLELVPVFPILLTSIGADDLNEDQFKEQEQLYTGGISVTHNIFPSKSDSNSFTASLIFQGSALSEDCEKLISLIEKVIKHPWLNNTQRINILLAQNASFFPNAVAGNGHSYARMYSSAGLSASATLREMWNGITYMSKMKEILNLSNIEVNNQENSQLSKMLHDAYYKNLVLSDKASFSASIVCNSRDKAKMNSLVKKLLSSLPYHSKSNKYTDNKIISDKMKEFLKYPKTHLKIDSSTYFCGISVPTPSYDDNSSPSFLVMAKLIRSEYLFSIIREKLGAYGSMCAYDSLFGQTSFLSYRDTNPILILHTFEDILETLVNKKPNDLGLKPIDKDMIDRAIVQVFSEFDRPTAPQNSGSELFFYGIDEDLLQKRRTKLLDVNIDDVINDCDYIIKQKNNGSIRKVIVGGEIKKELIPDFHVINVFEVI